MNTDDPIALLENLDPPTLRQRIIDLDRQRRALVVLLRAASARERPKRTPSPVLTEEVHHAD
jgi:hypothetical protein